MATLFCCELLLYVLVVEFTAAGIIQMLVLLTSMILRKAPSRLWLRL